MRASISRVLSRRSPSLLEHASWGNPEIDCQSANCDDGGGQNQPAKSNRVEWIRITSLESFTSKRFPPNAFILNSRDESAFSAMLRESAISVNLFAYKLDFREACLLRDDVLFVCVQ